MYYRSETTQGNQDDGDRRHCNWENRLNGILMHCLVNNKEIMQKKQIKTILAISDFHSLIEEKNSEKGDFLSLRNKW